MTDYTARNVLLKDSSGNYLIPYTEKADLSLGNLNSAGKAYVAIKGYDSTATYSLNEVVMTVVSGSVLFYRSLVDNNTASLSDTTKWIELDFGGGGAGGEINTPFFFGQSQYFENTPYNASWLASNGSYNASSLYPDFWTQLTGVELNTSLNVGDTIEISGKTYVKRGLPVVLSTGTITDYDFVVDSGNSRFRLPLLNGEEDLPSDRYIDLTLGASGSPFTASANGKLCLVKAASTAGQYIAIVKGSYRAGDTAGVNGETLTVEIDMSKGETATVSYSVSGSTVLYRFVYSKGNGALYYYVGDTVQDASLINAGAVLGQLSNKADIDASNFNATGRSRLAEIGMPDVANAQFVSNSFATDTNFTAPANGWYCCRGVSSAAGLIVIFMTSLDANDGVVAPYTGGADYVSVSGAGKNEILPVLKGTKIQVQHYNCNLSADVWCGLWFIPAKGEN